MKLLLFRLGWGGSQKSKTRSPPKCGALEIRFSYKTVTFRVRLGGTPEIQKKTLQNVVGDWGVCPIGKSVSVAVRCDAIDR